ncbi:MAG TPA: ATP cone domain-containing protein [Candidatus Paceibacterota bacterium]|nr:ATP cone domain-containing protein [Candidatus Paceibacterota bacterium]
MEQLKHKAGARRPAASPAEITIVKSTGEREAFDPSKLEASLVRAGASAIARTEIMSRVTRELRDGMTTAQIYRHAFSLLKRMAEHPVAARYSLRRAVMELGPAGFSFEKFVAEIFKEMGYSTKTDLIVRGGCVEHEVDVAAWTSKKLIFVEAKFHNSLGVKSDVKVALYVKARFDDLIGRTFDLGGERKLDEGWLLTNTKFTTTAVEYGLCQGLRMIGWNYPDKGNLQDLIQESGLHPITSLTSLSNKEKSDLLKQGIVLARTLRDEPGHLAALGQPTGKIKSVLREIEGLLA